MKTKRNIVTQNSVKKYFSQSVEKMVNRSFLSILANLICINFNHLTMKKLCLSVSLIVFIAVSTVAQQDPQFSQNMHNRLFPNPGVAGSNNAICATLFHRQQWTGFEGKPVTTLLSVHSPAMIIPGGVGLSIAQDGLGQIDYLLAKVAYAYRLSLGTGDLGIGIAAGLVNFSIDSKWVAIDDPGADPAIPAAGNSKSGFDLDFGLYYKTDKLYLGLSALHIPSSTLKATDINYTVARHYYIMAGYDYDLVGTDLAIKPSLFVKTDAASTQIDVNGMVEYKRMLSAGVSYRLNDAVVAMFGFKKEGVGPGDLKLGFSYDVTTSQLNNYSNGSFEVMAGYCFKLKDPNEPEQHKTVRFL